MCPTPDQAAQALALAQTGDMAGAQALIGNDVPGTCGVTGSMLSSTPAGAVQRFAGTIFSDWVADIQNGLADVVKWTASFFTSVPMPNLGNEAGPSPAVGFIRTNTLWLAGALLVASMIIGMVRMAIKNDPGEGMKLGGMIVRYLIMVTMSVVVLTMALEMGHAYSTWIIDIAGQGQQLGLNLSQLFMGGGVASAVLFIIVLIIAALASLFVAVMLLIRAPILVVICGLLPVLAANGTEKGKEHLDHVLGWTLAYVLFEPVVATLLATGFQLMATDTTKDGWGPVMWGVMLLLLSALSLPAIMRVVVPAASSMAGGRGLGSVALGAAATFAGLAAFGGGKMLSAAGTGSPSGPMPSQGGGSPPSGSSGGTGHTGPQPSGPQGPTQPVGSGSSPTPAGPATPPPAPPVSVWKPSPGSLN